MLNLNFTYKIIFSLFIIIFINACYPYNNTIVNEDNNIEIQEDKISSLIPLYIYPTNITNEIMNNLNNIKQNTKETVLIINPNNGSGDTVDENYQELINDLNNNNFKTIGYIYTSYGNRGIEEIKIEIDFYRNNYEVKGIFFDEVLLKDEYDNAYLKEISDYAKSNNLNYITLNPGTTIPQEYIDINYYDLIVTYEDSYEKYKNETKNVDISNEVTKQSLLVYGFNIDSKFDLEIEKAKNNNYDFIYLTIDNDGNPWDSLFNFTNYK